MTAIEFFLGKKWELILTSEYRGYIENAIVEDIEGTIFVSCIDFGIEFIVKNDDEIDSVHFYGGVHEGYSKFSGELPKNLRFNMNRDETRENFDDLIANNNNFDSSMPIIGLMPPWDKFDNGNTLVHIEYNYDCDSIRMITIMKK